MKENQIAPLRLLRFPEVLERTRLSKATIYRRLQAGKFPRPIRLGDRVVAWHADKIEQWVADRPDAGSWN